MKIAVAGTGYVGLVTGVCLSNIGHYVICVDNNESKILKLNKGELPICEPGLLDLVNQNKERLNFTTDYSNAYKNADVIFIGVGTPENVDGTANLEYINKVIEQISESVNNDCVVVVKSTVPIGTNDEIEKYFKDNSRYIIRVVSNPEFLSQGTAINDTLYASRIVIGTNDEVSKQIMEKLYEPLTKPPYNVPYLNMDRRSAEMVKYASNNYLALKISFINEIANLCEKINANIDYVTKGMSYDNRIGDKFLNVGIGYGGSCFPKDTKALYNIGKKNNIELKTVNACISVNNLQRMVLLKKLKSLYNNKIKGLTVAILGLTFKPNTDDIRESAALDNIVLLLQENVIIKAFDPLIKNDIIKIIEDRLTDKKFIRNFYFFDKISDAIKNSDSVLIFTEWEVIKNYDVNNYKLLMNTPIVIDGRNCYSLNQFKNSDIKYFSIGRNQ